MGTYTNIIKRRCILTEYKLRVSNVAERINRAIIRVNSTDGDIHVLNGSTKLSQAVYIFKYMYIIC